LVSALVVKKLESWGYRAEIKVWRYLSSTIWIHQRDGQREGERERERETDRQTDRRTYRPTVRRTDGQTAGDSKDRAYA